MKIVMVNFQKSRVESMRIIGLVPQFIDCFGNPIRIFNQYLLSKVPGWTRNTSRSYVGHIYKFASWLEESGADADEINLEILKQFAYYLATGQEGQTQLKTKTSISILRTIICFFDWYKLNGYLKLTSNEVINSAAVITAVESRLGILPKPIVEPIKFAHIEDALELIQTFATENFSNSYAKRNELIARLMLESGMRVAEIASLKFDALPEMPLKGHSALLAITGKGNKKRFVSISISLLSELQGFVEIERLSFLRSMPKKTVMADSLFLNRYGRELSTGFIQKLFRKCVLQTQVKITPHTLRHTFSTYHLLVNKNIVLLQKLLGHSSADTTRNFYAHAAKLAECSDEYQQWIEKLYQDSCK